VTLKRNTCECGCGTPTRLAPYSDRSKGWVAGEPVRFITGHNMFAKRRGYVIEDRGYETPCWIWQGEPVTGTENVRRGNVAKLNAEVVAEIRAFRDQYFREHPLNAKGQPRKRFAQGVVPELAERYGVSVFTIISVLKDRTWR
jgi:hypothetical protein